MTSRSLRTAGLLAMTSAFISIPLVYISYKLSEQTDWLAKMTEAGIQIFGTIVFVVITILLKKFLNDSFKFRLADTIINLLLKVNIVTGIFAVASIYSKELHESATIFMLIMIVLQGALQIVFGFRLLKLPDDLGGMLKPLCYLNIATGIALASIVLVPFGLVMGAISDLMLGTIFLQAARKLISGSAKPITQGDNTND